MFVYTVPNINQCNFVIFFIAPGTTNPIYKITFCRLECSCLSVFLKTILSNTWLAAPLKYEPGSSVGVTEIICLDFKEVNEMAAELTVQ